MELEFYLSIIHFLYLRVIFYTVPIIRQLSNERSLVDHTLPFSFSFNPDMLRADALPAHRSFGFYARPIRWDHSATEHKS